MKGDNWNENAVLDSRKELIFVEVKMFSASSLSLRGLIYAYTDMLYPNRESRRSKWSVFVSHFIVYIFMKD